METRNKVLDTAISQNDAIVRRVIAAVRDFHIDEGDIQTDSIHVEMAYDSHDGTVVDYYQVTKSVQVFLRDVSKFEPLLTAVLRAGANHIYDVQFSTSESRKNRNQARALAVKAAIEKAQRPGHCGWAQSRRQAGGTFLLQLWRRFLVQRLLWQSLRFAVVAECRPEYGRRRRDWPGRNRRPGKNCDHGQRDHAVQGGMRSAELKNGTAPKEFGAVF